ncbi:MAG: hypothetical protein IJW63_02035 [Lachnospiraceae bacterium]|nr:hypothetical protein [Lachnospiraceae bacterium]
MSDIFLAILNMSFSASILISVILLLRVVLKKMPRYIVCVLWALVAVRLVCPFNLESALSLVPSAEPIPSDIGYMKEPMINSGVHFVDEALNPIIVESFAPKTVVNSVNPIQLWIAIGANIWILGMTLMCIYTLISYLRLRKKVSASVCREGDVYVCDDIDSPFIFGVLKPRIYLPSFLNEEQIGHVLAHENAHLKRLDYLWKPLGFLLLTIYWFNPLMWISYIALSKDIELACDEKVVKTMGLQDKKAYSHTLVECSVSRKSISACPIAFGEVGVKDRVIRVLNYKKPSFWILMISVVAVCVVAVCFMTNPKEETGANSGVKQDQSQDIEIGNEQTEHQDNTGIPEQVGGQGQPGPEENGDTGYAPESNNSKENEGTSNIVDSAEIERVINRVCAAKFFGGAIPFVNKEIMPTGDQLYFLDATEDGTIELYGIHSDEYGYCGLMLNYIIDGEPNWNYYVDMNSWIGYELPDLVETEDGLFLICCGAGGSGCHNDKLYYLEAYETGTVSAEEITDIIVSQLSQVAEVRLDEAEEKVLIYSKEDGKETLVGSIPFTPDLKREEVVILNAGFNLNQVKFVTRDGLQMSVGAGVFVEDANLPEDVVSLLFNINASDDSAGHFVVDGTRIHVILCGTEEAQTRNETEEKDKLETEIQSLIEEVEAIKMLQEQLILAYENTYGKYIPSDVEPVGAVDDSVYLAYTIPRLQVSEETDEYYVIPVIWDFRVYKETGKITKYYNGIDPLETDFDPMAEGALGFAG